MGPYSHYILAAKLVSQLQPEQREAYFWGTLAPDIRYLANLRRDYTHFGQERVEELTACYPQLRSFLLGYQVHLLVDQIDVSLAVGAAFPLNLLKKVMRRSISPQQMTMLVERYYLRTGTVYEPFSGEHNEVLSDLGITPKQTGIYTQALQEYFEMRSFEAAVSTFQKIGMIENSRLEKYLNAYRAMQKRKVINSLLMLSIKNARLDSKVIKHVQEGMRS